MASMVMVIVGFFCFGIIRGRKLSLKGRLTYCNPMMKKQGVPFYPTGSPFDLKKLNFCLVSYPLSFLLDSNFQKEWVHWTSTLRSALTFSTSSPPRSLQFPGLLFYT